MHSARIALEQQPQPSQAVNGSSLGNQSGPSRILAQIASMNLPYGTTHMTITKKRRAPEPVNLPAALAAAANIAKMLPHGTNHITIVKKPRPAAEPVVNVSANSALNVASVLHHVLAGINKTVDRHEEPIVNQANPQPNDRQSVVVNQSMGKSYNGHRVVNASDSSSAEETSESKP